MIETSLPISVRDNADVGMLPVADRISREAMIRTSRNMEQSGWVVNLSLSDGKGVIFKMSALAGDEEQAKSIEKKFRLDAETYYMRILNMFLEE